MITSAGYVLNCDNEECASIVFGITRRHVREMAKSLGWTFPEGGSEYYCMAHIKAGKCTNCERYMVPRGRSMGDFPADWIRAGYNNQCVTCINRGKYSPKLLSEQSLNKMQQEYHSLFPLLKEFVNNTTEEQRTEWASNIVPDDLKEMVFG